MPSFGPNIENTPTTSVILDKSFYGLDPSATLVNETILENASVDGNLTVAGTVTTSGNLVTAGNLTVTGTTTSGNFVTPGTLTATGTVTGGNIVTAGNVNAGSLTVSSPVTIANGGTNAITATTATSNLQYLQGGTGSVARSLTNKFQDIVSAKDFGATGDGVTDDTAAIQAWATYVVANKKRGYLPEGTYILSAAISIPQGGNYSFIGAGRASSILRQTINNVPIFDMGATGSATCVFIEIAEIWFDYSVTPISGAYAINMHASYFLNSFHHLRMTGFYCFKVQSGQPAPQNTKFDEIDMLNSCTGGMMDWTGTTNSGPNNVIGRMQLGCVNAVGPIFNNIKGVNFNIDCLEFLSSTNATLILLQPGTNVSINTIKLEVFTYNTSGSMFIFDTLSNVKINQFQCYGTTSILNPASGSFYIFNAGVGGTNGSLHIDFLSLTANTVGSNVFAFNGSGGAITVNTYSNDGNANWNLTNNGSAATSEIVRVRNIANEFVNHSLGTSSYAVVLGDPTTALFNTTLTSPITVTLPSNGNNLFNGLKYKVITKGAVNGSNTIAISNGSSTIATLTTDQTVVEITWIRAASGSAGWNVSAAYGLAGGVTGAAGGDLSGSYPNPTVSQVSGLNLFQEVPNYISQYNASSGTTSQQYRLYKTRTDASNYERGTFFWTSNMFGMAAEAAGTGAFRDIGFFVGNAYRWVVSQNQFHPMIDASYDLGSASLSARTVYSSGIDVNKGNSLSIPATGATVTVNQFTNFQICDPVGALAALTIQFPVPLGDGHCFELSITQSITTLTMTPNSGASIKGSIGSVTNYLAVKYRYLASNTTWYQMT